ncbi:MAG TPA: hypothetical protein VIM19_08120, partial [Actinomycetes bacterium]
MRGRVGGTDRVTLAEPDGPPLTPGGLADGADPDPVPGSLGVPESDPSGVDRDRHAHADADADCVGHPDAHPDAHPDP